MNEIELMDKLAREVPLTDAEAAWLENRLEEQELSAVSKLPTEEPSLAWRSALNERLMALQPKPRRRMWFAWSGLATGAAALVFAALMLNSPKTVGGGVAGSVEAEMVASHELLVQQASAGLLTDDGSQAVNTEVLEWAETSEDNLY